MTTEKPDVAQQLEKLAKLRADGALSEDEFAQLKAKLIAGDSQPAAPKADSERTARADSARGASSLRSIREKPLTIFGAAIGLIIVAVFGLLLIGRGSGVESPADTNQSDQTSQAQSPSGNTADSAAAPGAPSMPDDETKFVAAVTSAQGAYNAAPNDMAKGRTRADRRSAICQTLQNGFTANGWTGTIKTLSSNTDGKGVLEVTLATGVSVETMNNDLSDIGHNTLLLPDSPIFAAASAMKEGDAVTFSGNFFPSDIDCVEEISLTLAGSMQEPAFIIRFTSVSSAPSSNASDNQPTASPQSPPNTQQAQSPDAASPTNIAPPNSTSASVGAGETGPAGNGSVATTSPADASTPSQNDHSAGPPSQPWNEAPIRYRATADDLSGAAAFDRGDFGSAFATLSPMVDREDPVAQFFIGVMYLGGHGVEKNPALGVQLLYKSATAGVADAQNYMAAFYRTGHNVPLDYTTAMRWYLFAAKQNYKNAQYRIALMYRDGLGVERNIQLAYTWACISSTDGPPEAVALRTRLQRLLSTEDMTQAEQDAAAWQARSITATPVSIYGLTGAEPVSSASEPTSSTHSFAPDVAK